MLWVKSVTIDVLKTFNAKEANEQDRTNKE